MLNDLKKIFMLEIDQNPTSSEVLNPVLQISNFLFERLGILENLVVKPVGIEGG